MGEPEDKPDKPDKPDHPQGGPPGQTGDHPQGGPPGQEPHPTHPIVEPEEEAKPEG